MIDIADQYSMHQDYLESRDYDTCPICGQEVYLPAQKLWGVLDDGSAAHLICIEYAIVTGCELPKAVAILA
jgi:hypothetical protein